MFQKKSLGQNFLRSKKVLGDIVKAGNIVPSETVLEIGPGEGALTEALLKTDAKVIAIEKDHRLIPILQNKFSSDLTSGALTLVEGDILDFNPPHLFLNPKPSTLNPSYKLISNIPYYITGVVLRKFLGAENQPSQIVFMLQKEVAQRIVARNGKESLLSISVKAYGDPEYISTVAKGNFSPVPKVDSAILSIENISKKNFTSFTEEKFFSVLKNAFAHKRKKVAGNLKKTYPDIQKILEKLQIGENARPEELSVTDWKLLVQNLK